MRIFFAGDVVGQVGVRAVAHWLPRLRADWGVHAAVINAENSAHGGKGITPMAARALFAAGADVLTGGNHSFTCPEIQSLQRQEPRLLRPANMPDALAGAGGVTVRLADGRSLFVGQVQGRVFMPGRCTCPFAAVDDLLVQARLAPGVPSLIDVHAEASSEKQALAWHLAGRVSAVVGTHTHVPTADARLLDTTAYVTDAGMCGPYASVIGMDVEAAVGRLRDGIRTDFRVGRGDVRIAGALIDVCDRTGEGQAVASVQVPYDDEGSALVLPACPL